MQQKVVQRAKWKCEKPCSSDERMLGWIIANLKHSPYFCHVSASNRTFDTRAYSSMDRISDSGSDDWGSTPHKRTIYKTSSLQIGKDRSSLMEKRGIVCQAH